MALSGVNIQRQTGGIARPPLNSDGISGLCVYSTSGSTAGTFEIFTAQESEDFLDIQNNNYDELIKYHIDQYFTFSNYKLYLKIVQSAPSDFQEVYDLQSYANGEMRQVGILNTDTAFASSDVGSIQTKLEEIESELKAPIVAIYTASSSDISTLSDLTSNNDYRVNVNIYESLSGDAPSIRTNTGFVSGLGTELGTLSFANVHENIGWVSKFDVQNGDEYLDIGFIDGSSLVNTSQTLLTQLDNYRYTFLRKYVGISGAYHNFSYTATANTSDFYSLENNRVYDKALRNLRQAYLPHVNRPIYVNDQGQLQKGDIQHLIEVGENALSALSAQGEVSGYSVDIDPNQDVITSNELTVVAEIQPVGVSKTITVQLGFTLQTA